ASAVGTVHGKLRAERVARREQAGEQRIDTEFSPAGELAIEDDGERAGKVIAIGHRAAFADMPRGPLRENRRRCQVDADAYYRGRTEALEEDAGELGAGEHQVVGPLDPQRLRRREMVD